MLLVWEVEHEYFYGYNFGYNKVERVEHLTGSLWQETCNLNLVHHNSAKFCTPQTDIMVMAGGGAYILPPNIHQAESPSSSSPEKLPSKSHWQSLKSLKIARIQQSDGGFGAEDSTCGKFEMIFYAIFVSTE